MARAIRNLLDELSWEGRRTSYRGGGAGKENVLTAEVWQALDTLPRSAFLGGVLERAHRVGLTAAAGASAVEADSFRSAQVVGDLECGVLCGDRSSGTGSIRVQPDVLLESDEAVGSSRPRGSVAACFRRNKSRGTYSSWMSCAGGGQACCFSCLVRRHRFE